MHKTYNSKTVKQACIRRV